MPPSPRAAAGRRLRRQLDRRRAAATASRSPTNTSRPTAPRSARASSLLLSEDACPVAETARVARWLAEQSAGQCGPCVHGLDAIATTRRGARRGVGAGERSRAHRSAWRRSCAVAAPAAIPTAARSLIISALDAFAAEFADHARHGPCEACARAQRSCRCPRHPRSRAAHAEPVVMSMSQRLRVNPIACEAHGMCAELLPERISLDEWGYPIIDERAADAGARSTTPGAPPRPARRSRCCSSAIATDERRGLRLGETWLPFRTATRVRRRSRPRRSSARKSGHAVSRFAGQCAPTRLGVEGVHVRMRPWTRR